MIAPSFCLLLKAWEFLIFSYIASLYRQLHPLKSNQVELKMSRTILERDAHCISRKHISENALKVLYRLHNAGFAAYLVGGGVRDLLLGRKPKDFDVATNAHPEEIRKLFRNSRLIGRRFRLAHVVFGRDVIEVATFRGHHNADTQLDMAQESASGRLLRITSTAPLKKMHNGEILQSTHCITILLILACMTLRGV